MFDFLSKKNFSVRETVNRVKEGNVSWTEVAVAAATVVAIGPIIPLIAGVGLWLFEEWEKRPKDTTGSIVILGMKGAGKTTLWNRLRGNREESRATQLEQIKSFSMRKPDGKLLHIAQTIDIGGQSELVADYYRKLIEKDTFIYFVFRISDLQDKGAVEEIQDRVALISHIVKENNIPNDEIGIKYVATHLDQTGRTKEEFYDEIKKELKIDRKNIIIGSLVGSDELIDEIKNDIIEGTKAE